MTHPGPQLTEYVDGTLPSKEHARIEAHLRSCAACRRDVALAEAGRRAVTTMPAPAVPDGVADAALAEAARVASTRAPTVTPHRAASDRPRPVTPRWLAIVGAAAAIALVALVVPRLGQPGTSTPEFAAGAAASDAAAPATAVEVQDVNYGPDIVSRVAVTFGRTDVGAVGVAAPAAGAGATVIDPVPDAEAASLAPDRLHAATRCLAAAYPNQGAVLARVILAHYEGQPAYLGIYLQGPGGGLPADIGLVVVAAVPGCQPLRTGTFNLP